MVVSRHVRFSAVLVPPVPTVKRSPGASETEDRSLLVPVMVALMVIYVCHVVRCCRLQRLRRRTSGHGHRRRRPLTVRGRAGCGCWRRRSASSWRCWWTASRRRRVGLAASPSVALISRCGGRLDGRSDGTMSRPGYDVRRRALAVGQSGVTEIWCLWLA